MADSLPPWVIEVFFDGACPLCRREIAFIRKRDKCGRILLTDIAAAGFDPRDLGISLEALNAEIHGRLPDGTWLTGVEVFRRLYQAIGFGALVWATRLSGIASLLDWGYTRFARNRLRWTGRCTEQVCSPHGGD